MRAGGAATPHGSSCCDMLHHVCARDTCVACFGGYPCATYPAHHPAPHLHAALRANGHHQAASRRQLFHQVLRQAGRGGAHLCGEGQGRDGSFMVYVVDGSGTAALYHGRRQAHHPTAITRAPASQHTSKPGMQGTHTWMAS